MTREERREFMKMIEAHTQTIGVCEACARTTRDLADEVRRGGTPSRDDLVRTVEEAERVLEELRVLRTEVERLGREVA
jgi:hypothetical protein